MKEFNTFTGELVLKEIQDAMDVIVSRLGLRAIHIKKAKHNPFKLSFSLDAFIDHPVDRAMLESAATQLGLSPAFLDRIIVVADKQLRIIDFETGIKPVILEDIHTFDRYALSVKKFMQAIEQDNESITIGS